MSQLTQSDAFPDITPGTQFKDDSFCSESYKRHLEEKMEKHKTIVKKCKKMIKHMEMLLAKRKEIQNFCEDKESE